MCLQEELRDWFTYKVRPRLVPWVSAAIGGFLLYWLLPMAPYGTKTSFETWVAERIAGPPLIWFGAYPVVFVAKWFPIIAATALLLLFRFVARLLPSSMPIPVIYAWRVAVLTSLGFTYYGAIELDLYSQLPEAVRIEYAHGSLPDPMNVMGWLMIGVCMLTLGFMIARRLGDE